MSGADPSAPVRVFFALWPDPAIRDPIVAMARDVVERAGGTAARPENVHLTLAFVGDIASERIAALEDIGDAAARTVAPFTLVLDCIGVFHNAGIAWLGTRAMPPELVRLAHALNAGLEASQFRVERRLFHAHVTLARKCRRLPDGHPFPQIVWRVGRVTLMASELRPRGSLYRELAAWPLVAT